MAAVVSMQQIPDSGSCSQNIADEENEESEKVGELVNITPSKNPKKRLLRQGSVSENFYAVKGAALIVPRQSSIAQSMEVMQIKKHGGDLQSHLYAIFNHIRSQDTIKLAVRLESWSDTRVRYLVIVSTIGRQDTEESIIVGMDFQTCGSPHCTIGLVIPVWSDTVIRLDGDGGFKITGRDKTHTFKPVSVQAMWSALQTLHKCVDIARMHNYYFGSLFLTWTCNYESRISSPRLCMNEWEYLEDLYSRRKNFFQEGDAERAAIEAQIRVKLKQVMMKMNLDSCTSRDIRLALEKECDLDLKEYKKYIDKEMLTILGQMDVASKILDYLYLGSEWNASDGEELKEIGITHILNITMEIDNFFPDAFIYKNIRCFDVEATDLLSHWNETWKFVRSAKKSKGKCLVHCRMGISRSAATVSAYLMKENNWSMEKALAHVKERRVIVQPNSGFMRQLVEYDGILRASYQRHNRLFRTRSESNLSQEMPSSKSGLPSEGSTHSHSSTTEPVTFDLNRKLLDLDVLPYRSRIARPKSWSPEDAKPYYTDAEDFFPDDGVIDDDDLHSSHMSEPHGYFTPIQAANENRAYKNRVQEKRKKWRRRHTEQIFSDALLDTTNSEDSVFANPGGLLPRVDAWVLNDGVVKPQPKKNLSNRLSSPAAIQSTDRLDVAEDAKAHSSLASPMNSPSYKITKNVSVSDLKSRFMEDVSLRIEIEKDLGDDFNDGGIVITSGNVSPKPTVAVRDLIADIESPSGSKVPEKIEGDSQEEEVASDSQRRERSLSENQVFHVRSIVSKIESGSLADADTATGTAGTAADKENTKSGGPAVTISRSQSLPARRKKPPLSPPLEVLPVIEDKQIESESPQRAKPHGGSNSNANNNNSNSSHEFNSTTVIEIEPISIEESVIVKTISQPGCCITERVLPSAFEPQAIPHGVELSPTHAELRLRSVVRTLTQSELQVIREVGKTFLSDSDECSSILSSETSSSLDASVVVAGEAPLIKRGVVRKMARLIENQLQKEHEGSSDVHYKPRSKMDDLVTRDVTSGSNVVTSVNPTTVINKLLMGEPSGPFHEGDQNSNPLSAKTKTSSAFSSLGSLKDLINLVGPTPYSPAHTSLAAKTDKPMFPRRVTKSPAKNIRRTQSERSVIRPIERLHQGSRGRENLGQISSKSNTELDADPALSDDVVKSSTRDEFSVFCVKDLVRKIEKSGRKEVSRVRSFHCTRTTPSGVVSDDHSASSKRKGSGPVNILHRSLSNPHFFRKPAKEESKKAVFPFPKIKKKKSTNARRRTSNPLYQTM